jgi:hypothetical protein
MREIHLAHPADAKGVVDFVGAEAGARRQWHGLSLWPELYAHLFTCAMAHIQSGAEVPKK